MFFRSYEVEMLSFQIKNASDYSFEIKHTLIFTFAKAPGLRPVCVSSLVSESTGGKLEAKYLTTCRSSVDLVCAKVKGSHAGTNLVNTRLTVGYWIDL